MKAVVYHADTPSHQGDYARLMQGMVKNCHAFDMQVIHLTLTGFPGWGDENRYFDGLDPSNIVYNREQCFADFLEHAKEDVYWFTEPDARIIQAFPPLLADLCLLERKDSVPLCPAWRLATPKAAPFFREIAERMKLVEKLDWHGDSEVFTAIYKELDKWNVELRDYALYIPRKGIYSRNYKGKDKRDCP